MNVQNIHIKKGRDLKLFGAPDAKVIPATKPSSVALLVHEFPYIKPKLDVSEGDSVKIGSKLFHNKECPEMHFLSPGAGKIQAIERGERRSLQRIIINLDKNEDSEKFAEYSPGQIESITRKECVEHLLAGGLWPYLRERPFSGIANPEKTPRSIFVNGMNTEPLSSETRLSMLNQKDAFKAGLDILQKLTSGSVYLSVKQGDEANIEAFGDLGNCKLRTFSGPHPSGNTSVHIQSIERLRKNETIWTITASQTALIGWLFLEGRFPIERTMAISGPGTIKAQHYLTRLGASIDDLVQDNVQDGPQRYISGSVLSGFKNQRDGHLSFYKPDITILPEGKYRTFLGWMGPGLNKLSFSRAFLSALSPNKERYADTNLNGSLRSIVSTDVYDRYSPLDIYSVPLIKAIIGDDLEKAEQLGLLECDPEDFALAGFMCPSKLDVCSIIKNGLMAAKKELE